MFTLPHLAIGLMAAFIVGISKTAIPGAGLLATPLLATVFHGRALPGTALGILIFADLFAVRTFRRDARWDVLRPLAPWVAAGFAVGAAFFVLVGKSVRTLDVVIAVLILVVVGLQVLRLIRKQGPGENTPGAAAFYGTTGGFATFMSNNAGPILNAHLSRLGLSKEEFIGTSSWFYFIVNLAKVPLYLAIGLLSDGGRFFTGRSLLYDLATVPGVLAGVWLGRIVFPRIKQQQFMAVVLFLSAVGAVKLLIG